MVGAGTGIDEVADVGVARSNDAVERRDDALVALQLFEAAHVGPACVDSGLRSDVISAGLVGLLLRDGVLGQQRLPPVAGHAGKVRIGLHALQFGARLVQLLVDFGRLDLGQEIAFAHVRANVEVPLLQVAVGARVDGRIGKCLYIAGKREIVGLRSLHRMHDID